MATKREDDGGYKKGAKGIDGRKGEDFVQSQRNNAKEKEMFGHGYSVGWSAAWGKD